MPGRALVNRQRLCSRHTGPTGRGQLDFPDPKPVKFVRGLPAEATFGEMKAPWAFAFVIAPQTRFLRKLAIGGFAYEFLDDEHEDEDLSAFDMDELADQLHDRRRMSAARAAVARVRDSYSFDAHADDLISFFREVMGGLPSAATHVPIRARARSPLAETRG